METETEPITAVVFRKWPAKEGGECLALFPEFEEGRYRVSSYQHTGQHGLADYHGCIQATAPASPEEYEPLQRELESIGYRLKVYRKASHLLPWRKRS